MARHNPDKDRIAELEAALEAVTTERDELKMALEEIRECADVVLDAADDGDDDDDDDEFDGADEEDDDDE